MRIASSSTALADRFELVVDEDAAPTDAEDTLVTFALRFVQTISDDPQAAAIENNLLG